MGWETRGSNSYYYRKQRVGNRVVSRYVGAGALGELVAKQDILQRMERKAEAEAFRNDCNADLAVDRELDETCAVVRDVLTTALLLTGHHTHKRQWRKMRT